MLKCMANISKTKNVIFGNNAQHIRLLLINKNLRNGVYSKTFLNDMTRKNVKMYNREIKAVELDNDE